MALYKYEASDIKGEISSGQTEAADPARLKAALKEKQGLFLLSFEEVRKDSAGKRLRSGELSDFCRELGSMLGSGITIVKALSVISARSENARLRTVYDSLNTQIRRGMPLSAAMAQQGRAFPELLVNMVMSGEESGRLPSVCMKMAEHYEKEKQLSSQVKAALAYPVMLAVMTLLVVIGIFTFILPSFMKLFKDMEVPLITRILMGFSTALRKYWFLFLLGAAVLAAAVVFIMRLESVRTAFDKLKIKIPVAGRLVRIICTARFARTLASLYGGGLSMTAALNVAKNTVGNKYIEKGIPEAVKKVRSGESLSNALSAVDGFDVKLIRTIAVGEETGMLESLLSSAAESFEYEAAAAMKKLVSIIEPVMICIMAAVIVTVVLAVMLPIYSLYTEIDNAAPLAAMMKGRLR